MVPSGWCFKKLSELACSSKNSFAIGPFGSDLVMSDYRDEGTPIVFVRDIKRGAFNWVSNTFVDIEKAKSLKAHSVKAGDITITKMGLPPGIAAVYPESMPDGIVTADIIRLRLDTANYDASFICLLLNSYDVSKQVKLRTAGQTRPKLTLKDYKSIGVCLPKLDEQRKIAKILSTWDKAVATTEQLIETSKQQKKALMQQLLTGKKRLVNPETGKVFEDEWEFVRAGNVFQTRSNKKHNSDLPILAITQDKGAIPRELIDYNVSVTNDSISGYKVVEQGDFIISLRSFQGGIEYSKYKGICSPAYVILYPKIEIVDAFYKYHLKSHPFIQAMKSRLEGIRDGKIISYKYFSEIKLPQPSLKEQQKIASVLTASDKEIELLEVKLAHFKREKKALMQQLLTGKRRVKVDGMEAA
ncbi:restriction endonuclease subunit S [Vibrio parahaemolyticus]|uniref:restriction endonuclease subunit S n=1 Tax=Vibrio parahaemolyticus TaxID=670 RepID=UPI001869F16D|nr:restriction endonuclease subunit S [Vibrio parahaemolyticus]EIV8664346.1 restriction endonuclease subunit S [Vibrio parahaemolyticus]MBE4244545.1 restriction endonuclease subunit S [Vibrio parahaemolyticus]